MKNLNKKDLEKLVKLYEEEKSLSRSSLMIML